MCHSLEQLIDRYPAYDAPNPYDEPATAPAPALAFEQEIEPILSYCDYCGQLPCECLLEVCPLCHGNVNDCDCDFEVHNPSPALPGKATFVRGFAFSHWRTHNRKRLAYSRYQRKYHPAKNLLATRSEARQLHKYEGWLATLPEISGLMDFAAVWDFAVKQQKYSYEHGITEDDGDCPF